MPDQADEDFVDIGTLIDTTRSSPAPQSPHVSKLSHLELVKPKESYNYEKLIDFCKHSLKVLTLELVTSFEELDFNLDGMFKFSNIRELSTLELIRYRNN